MASITIPTGDFVTTTLNGAISSSATSLTIGTGLNIPATNGVLQIDYDSLIAVGTDYGPETIFYTTYTTATGAVTGVTRGVDANTSGVAHNNGASVQLAPSTLLLTGELAYAQVVADQASITTIADLTGLAVTVTVPAGGRKIKITGQVLLKSSVADDEIRLSIREGSTLLTAQQVDAGNGQDQGCVCQYVVAPTAGSHTYKLSAERVAGSGSITMSASATIPAFILCELI